MVSHRSHVNTVRPETLHAPRSDPGRTPSYVCFALLFNDIAHSTGDKGTRQLVTSPAQPQGGSKGSSGRRDALGQNLSRNQHTTALGTGVFLCPVSLSGPKSKRRGRQKGL